jgi:hypothetical protein
MEKNFISDWKLERYLLGELPAREIEYLRVFEGLRGGVWERVEVLRASNGTILRRYPPVAMGRKIETASAVNRDGVSKWRLVVQQYQPLSVKTSNVPFWAVPAMVCAAVALLIIPLQLLPTAQTDTAAVQYLEGVDRAKGTGTGAAPSIEVWRKNGAEAERLTPEALARSGDVVQLRYIVPTSCYGALISVDGRGALTVHLSGDSGKAAPLTSGRPIALSDAYQLDDAPLFETFYLVTAKDNFDIESVKRSLLDESGGRYLPEDGVVAEFTLRK